MKWRKGDEMTEQEMRKILKKLPKDELINQILIKNELIIKLTKELDEKDT